MTKEDEQRSRRLRNNIGDFDELFLVDVEQTTGRRDERWIVRCPGRRLLVVELEEKLIPTLPKFSERRVKENVF